MRRDLRKLLSRYRTELIRRATLEDAIEEACGYLVSDRFRHAGPHQEASRFVQPFLARFEDRIALAPSWARAGEHRRAIHGVEEAAEALVGAREMARAEEEWRHVRSRWQELSESYGLAAFPGFATVRVAERSLAIAEAFLGAGEARKARFVARQLRVGLDRLAHPEVDEPRRASLIRRLVTLRASGRQVAEALTITAGRLVDDGLLELSERLTEDWWADGAEGPGERREVPGAGSRLPSLRLGPSSLPGRFAQIEREASHLGGALAELAASAGTTAEPGAAETETEVE